MKRNNVRFTMNKAKKDGKILLFDFLNILIWEYRTHTTGKRMSINLQNLLNILRAFCIHQKVETLDFEEINETFFKDFNNYAFKVKRFRIHTYTKRVEDIVLVLKLAKNRGIYKNKILLNSPNDAQLNKIVYPCHHSKNINPLAYDHEGKYTFNGFVEAYLLERESSLGARGLQSLQSRLRLLNHFASDIFDKNGLEWIDIDHKLPLKFQNWAYSEPRKYSKNYVGRILKHIRTWAAAAQQEGIKGITNDYKLTAYSLATAPIDSVALNFEEVNFLADLDLQHNERLCKIRDVFVVGCLTGLRYSDISRLGKDNFTTVNNVGKPLSIIDIVTKKTGERVNIPLHSIAQNIVNRNGGKLPRVPSNQKFNTYIKELCELAEMTETIQLRKSVAGKMTVKISSKFENITSHTARRTFATIAYIHFKMPIALIMKMTGHKTEREFLKYVQVDRATAAIEISNYF